MKFITEEYLRDLYRKKPFDAYKLEQGQRLTPGAVEYLSDKGIRMNDNIPKAKDNTPKVKDSISKPDNDVLKLSNNVPEGNQEETIKPVVDINSNLKKKLCCKLKSIGATFLITSSEILEEDVNLAQNITNLGRKISNIRNVVDGNGILESIHCRECTGINLLNFRREIDDCFEITEFHMQLKKSSTILKIHALRCTLQELQFEIIETYKNDDDDLKNRIMGNVNSIINSLSQMICLSVGGEKCQREK
jgi:ethanolamine utilization cobalamin adenosyltransferase